MYEDCDGLLRVLYACSENRAATTRLLTFPRLLSKVPSLGRINLDGAYKPRFECRMGKKQCAYLKIFVLSESNQSKGAWVARIGNRMPFNAAIISDR